jgi:hypothetical protein
VSIAKNQSHRRYSARIFSRAALTCPHCQAESSEAAEACSRCGFAFGACQKAFPFAPPPLSLVIDPSKLLPDGIEGEIQGALQKVRKRFPQVDFSFCFVRLAAGSATQEFAFWLHNSAPGADQNRAWQVLLVGDLTSGSLALTVGYALEPFIKPRQWEAALQELAACIADEQWKQGLTGFLTDARDLLSLAWSAADQRRQKGLRRPEEPASRVSEPASRVSEPAQEMSEPPQKRRESVPEHPAAVPKRDPPPQTAPPKLPVQAEGTPKPTPDSVAVKETDQLPS